ncbi:MAG: hypothetical protein ACFFAH_01830 [Promethearchaeota archaeon]
MKIIQDLWILTSAGVVLFKRVYDAKINAQMFGALLSALSSFSRENVSGELTSFELRSIRFTIVKKNRFLFVCNSSKRIKEKRVQEELEDIANEFFKKYPIEWLKNEWDQDVSVFNDFEKDIEFALEDPVTKFWSEVEAKKK